MDIVTIVLCVLLMIIISLMLMPDSRKLRVSKLLQQIPGPPTYPIFGNALELVTSPLHRYWEIHSKRNKNYEPVYITWTGSRPEICINNAEATEVILNNSDHIDKSEEYSMLLPWIGNCLLLKKGHQWRALRKLFLPSFSPTALDKYFDIFKTNAEICVEKLSDKVGKGEFDICPFLARFTLDIICETAGGVKIGTQNDNNMSFINAIHEITEMLLRKHTTPWLSCDFILRRSQVGIRLEEAISTVHAFSNKVVQDRLNAKHELLDGKLNTNENESLCSEVQRMNIDTMGILLDKLTAQELRETMDGMVFAGHDTTYSGLSWAIQLLGEHQKVQEKVFEEMERIFGASKRAPTKEDLQDMKYLECVIKETLRLYPSAPSIGRRANSDIQIGKYTIPAGISVWIQIFFIHRKPEYFPNPEEFDPDNFLPERVRERHPYAYLPFSAGPRSCLGRKYAITEMKTLLSYLVRSFKFRSVNKTKDLPPVFGLTLTVHGGVHIELKRRST